jgi:hypothetical protein
MKRNAVTLLLASAAATVAAASAGASAPPVGKLPPAKTVVVKATPGKTLTVTLPKPAIRGGVWRVARAFDAHVVRQQGEHTLASGAIRITLRTTGRGTTRVVFALTKGETAKAYAARVWRITVGGNPAMTR